MLHYGYKKVSVNWYNEQFVRRPRRLPDDEQMDVCACKEGDDCEDNCVNRAMLIECSKACSKGDRCKNQVSTHSSSSPLPLPSTSTLLPLTPPSPPHWYQRLSRRQYAKTSIIKTANRGHGLIAAERIGAGSLILEYCGEVISLAECYARLSSYQADGITDFYMFRLSRQLIIDARLVGNAARFINHSCDANAYTQSWTVGPQQRVGIWAKRDIEQGEEITYDYNAQTFNARGEDDGVIQHCRCGSDNCSQYLGERLSRGSKTRKGDNTRHSDGEGKSQKEKGRKQMKKRKKKEEETEKRRAKDSSEGKEEMKRKAGDSAEAAAKSEKAKKAERRESKMGKEKTTPGSVDSASAEIKARKRKERREAEREKERERSHKKKVKPVGDGDATAEAKAKKVVEKAVGRTDASAMGPPGKGANTARHDNGGMPRRGAHRDGKGEKRGREPPVDEDDEPLSEVRKRLRLEAEDEEPLSDLRQRLRLEAANVQRKQRRERKKAASTKASTHPRSERCSAYDAMEAAVGKGSAAGMPSSVVSSMLSSTLLHPPGPPAPPPVTKRHRELRDSDTESEVEEAAAAFPPLSSVPPPALGDDSSTESDSDHDASPAPHKAAGNLCDVTVHMEDDDSDLTSSLSMSTASLLPLPLSHLAVSFEHPIVDKGFSDGEGVESESVSAGVVERVGAVCVAS